MGENERVNYSFFYYLKYNKKKTFCRTKTVVRYHTPFIIEQLKIIAQNKERLILECDAAWENLLGFDLFFFLNIINYILFRKFGQNYHFFHQIVQQLANLDCLLSLSTTAKSLGYTKPIVSDEEQQVFFSLFFSSPIYFLKLS